MSKPSAEQLMALADGELDAAASRELEAQIAADPQLAMQYRVFVETKEPISRLFASRAQDAVPERLVALVQDYDLGAQPHGTARPRKLNFGSGMERLRRRFADAVVAPQFALAGIAAAFALGLALGVTLPNGPATTQSPTGEMLVGWHPAGSGLGAALEAKSSGARVAIGQAGGVAIAFRGVLSFRSKAGEFCRQYRLEPSDGRAQLGVACRRDRGGWKDVIRVTGAKVGALKPAVSVATQQVDQTIDRLIAGNVMDGSNEARMIAAGWRDR